MELKVVYETYLKEYVSECSDVMLRKLVILRTAVLLHPILKDSNAGFEEPVAVVFDSKEGPQEMFRHILGFDDAKPYPVGSLTKKICGQIAERGYEAFPLLCRNGKECEKLISLQGWCQSFENADRNNRLLLIAFPDLVPETAVGYLAGQIRIKIIGSLRESGKEIHDSFVRMLLEFMIGRIPAVLSSIKRQEWKTTREHVCYGMEPIYAAQMILVSLVHEIYQDEQMEQELHLYENALEVMETEWELTGEFDQWPELFRDRLYSFASKWEGILLRERVPGKYFENLQDWPLFDQKYYYITQRDFEEISAPLAEIMGTNRLKSLLAEAGIIKSEGGGRKYYTLKVPVMTEYGAYVSQRRIQIVRRMIDYPGDLSMKELLQKKSVNFQTGIYPVLGNIFGLEEEVSISATSNNQHIMILGGSGSGKTVAAQKIEKGLARQGAAVIVLNYNQTHSVKKNENVVVINAKYDGIPISIPNPMKNEDEDINEQIEALVEMFSSFSAMGSRQQAVFRKACKETTVTWDGETNVLKRLQKLLIRFGGERIVEKYGQIFNHAVFRENENFWENGKITIIDFGDYSPRMQSILTGMTLFSLWQKVLRTGQTMEKPLWVVCDEFQAIDSYGFRQLEKILREGRKFKTSLILATQTLAGFDSDEKRLLQLPSTKLYFHPVTKDAEEWSRYIAEETDLSEGDAKKLLLELEKGSCMAVGNFQIVEEKTKALKMQFRIE